MSEVVHAVCLMQPLYINTMNTNVSQSICYYKSFICQLSGPFQQQSALIFSDTEEFYWPAEIVWGDSWLGWSLASQALDSESDISNRFGVIEFIRNFIKCIPQWRPSAVLSRRSIFNWITIHNSIILLFDVLQTKNTKMRISYFPLRLPSDWEMPWKNGRDVLWNMWSAVWGRCMSVSMNHKKTSKEQLQRRMHVLYEKNFAIYIYEVCNEGLFLYN